MFKYRMSVIVPVYNCEDYLASCLDSLLRQTISKDELEVLLIDDGSKDGSLGICKEYAEKHQISWKQLMDVMAELEERSKNFKSYDEWEIHIAKYTQELEEQQAKARKIKGERENKVQLMTIHSAKGLEFEDVFVIHANEGEIPHQKAEKKDEIEEERRLFYVALTRAKNNLCISYITQKNGNSIKPSRFVEELLGQRIK